MMTLFHKTVLIQNTLHNKLQIHLELNESAWRQGRRRGGKGDERRVEEKCCVMVGGWESKRQARPAQTASISFWPPVWVYVRVCECARVSVPSPQPDNRAGPVPDWGQLVAAGGRRRKRRGRRRRAGGGRYQTPLSDLCVWMGRERDQKSGSRLNHHWRTGSSEGREERRTRRRIWATRGFFFWLPHTSFTTWLQAGRLNWVKM